MPLPSFHRRPTTRKDVMTPPIALVGLEETVETAHV